MKITIDARSGPIQIELSLDAQEWANLYYVLHGRKPHAYAPWRVTKPPEPKAKRGKGE